MQKLLRILIMPLNKRWHAIFPLTGLAFVFLGSWLIVKYGLIPPVPRPKTPETPDWIEATRLWQCSDLSTSIRLRYVGNDASGSFVVECR